jgi:dipeptidyl aminopeptidase/acylaminoacyl peptidase
MTRICYLFVVILLGSNIFAQEIIDKMPLKTESDVMTPEILWSFGRLSDVQISPDGKNIIYGLSYYSKEQDKGNRDLYKMDLATQQLLRLTKTVGGEYNALWRPDGKKIGFLSASSGSMQLWEMNPQGGKFRQVTDIDGGISGFQYSPDGSKILFAKEVKIDPNVQDLYPDLDKSTGRVMHDLMYRHWDTWVDSYSHIFVADYSGEMITTATDIMKDQPYDSPQKPFGGMEELAWTPDSKAIAYTCKKLKGKAYSISTNSDIYLYDLAAKSTHNLTQGMPGYDMSPVFSPDGKMMAWESMARDGYESDKIRLFVLDMKSGKKKDYTANFDQNVHGLRWSDDGNKIFFISDWHGSFDIYELTLKTNTFRKITEGVHNYRSIALAGDRLIATRQSMSMPTEIFSVNIKDGKDTQMSFVNDDLLKQLKMGRVEARWVNTTDGKKMLTWVIYPPHFDPDKKYPALLYCQGGPQSMVSQFWSYRWNFQMMAANDYIIVAPNRRGLPGFGQAWNEQISGDYGGQNMKDYFSAIDSLKKESFIDENRLGAVGASYGGFSVYWLAGHHNKRFKAFIAHDGIFNLEQQYLETEEMWFANWDMGGAYWDKGNKIAQNTFANSPHKFVDQWDTPILIIHSEKDYRIVASQGMSAFNAAILRGIPAEYLYFPNENHWVLHPQNGILWQRRFFAFLDKWLK